MSSTHRTKLRLATPASVEIVNESHIERANVERFIHDYFNTAYGAKDVYLGFPESLFVRLNAVFSRLVDKFLRKQNQSIAEYAQLQRETGS